MCCKNDDYKNDFDRQYDKKHFRKTMLIKMNYNKVMPIDKINRCKTIISKDFK